MLSHRYKIKGPMRIYSVELYVSSNESRYDDHSFEVEYEAFWRDLSFKSIYSFTQLICIF